MRSTLVLLAAAATSVAAARTSRRHPAHIRRQTGPVAPGTAADCTYYDTAVDSSYICDFFQSDWGLSAADFLDYVSLLVNLDHQTIEPADNGPQNPSVGADCSGIIVGNSYCVEVNYGLPRPTTRPTTTSPATTAAPAPTGPSKPSPTQDGLAADCTDFYLAVRGDTCDKIVAAHGGAFTLADFYKWNPAVGTDCSGLWLSTYYCVGAPKAPADPATTTAPGPSKPSPTQEGLAADCTDFYFAVRGDTCDKIVSSYGGAFTLADFYKWNPAVGNDCAGLWASTYYCVGAPKATTTTAAEPGPTAPAGPSPTQDGIVAGCQRYHQAVSGDTCQGIVDRYGTFSLTQFYGWNPAVGSGCSGLWLGYYYCIGKSTTISFITTMTLFLSFCTELTRVDNHRRRRHPGHPDPPSRRHLQPVRPDARPALRHLRLQEVAPGRQRQHVRRHHQAVRHHLGQLHQLEPQRRVRVQQPVARLLRLRRQVISLIRSPFSFWYSSRISLRVQCC